MNKQPTPSQPLSVSSPCYTVDSYDVFNVLLELISMQGQPVTPAPHQKGHEQCNTFNDTK